MIGAILADTLAEAQRAAGAVVVQYDVMEPVITIAVSPGKRPLTPLTCPDLAFVVRGTTKAITN